MCQACECSMSVPGPLLRPMPSRRREGISAGEGERERGREEEYAQDRKMRRIGGRAFLGGGVGCWVEVCERTLRECTFSAPSACKQSVRHPVPPTKPHIRKLARTNLPCRAQVLETCRSLGCWCTCSEVGDRRAGNQH